ncbi:MULTISPECIES: hypothetical protein [Mycobacterium]|uniref:Uncharacterized protein n=1 Tax=Mycobacterium palustre TaxID=153971 RepID=A0A1X1ZLB9_9MYCO|nr:MULTISPECIES: hypothetical protein [Mycobacterium]MCV7260992.1 hypothetical protein [Mycobacterium shimoidei]ODR13584.1 hypothetical protein BHQ16_09585 [Mycobacterium shimoidei]ORW24085.1 hypothetical protein AWC19_10035 [Mycobacterium palustre]ORW76503.1 hypothetical protein AWC26_20885 [Mycobacterium shimoidei]
MTNSEPGCAGVFQPLDEAQLRQRTEDLLRRAALVAEFGWDQFRYQWSTGEVVGTALALDDCDELLRFDETVDSALARWACDLWGIADGQADMDAGCPTTRAWFNCIRAELAGKPSTPATRKE